MDIRLKFKSENDWKALAGVSSLFGFLALYAIRLASSVWELLGIAFLGVLSFLAGYASRRDYKKRKTPQFYENTFYNVVSWEIISGDKKKNGTR